MNRKYDDETRGHIGRNGIISDFINSVNVLTAETLILVSYVDQTCLRSSIGGLSW